MATISPEGIKISGTVAVLVPQNNTGNVASYIPSSGNYAVVQIQAISGSVSYGLGNSLGGVTLAAGAIAGPFYMSSGAGMFVATGSGITARITGVEFAPST